MKLALTLLFVAAIWLIQCLVGGTRLVYSLPSYAILGLAAVVSLVLIRRPLSRPNLFCLGTTAVFFTYILIRAALTPVDYLWWMDFYMVLACLVVYLLTALYITSARLRLTIVAALLVLALAEFLIGLRQFTGADNWMPFGFVRSDYGGRASGMFISSIHLAGYLEAVGVMALSLAIWSSWDIWKRVAVGYMGVLCYAGVAITGSRGGYLSSVFSLLVFAAVTLWTRRKVNPDRFRLSLVLALLALGIFLGGALTIMQKSSLLAGRLNLIGKPDVRIYNWQAALDQFKLAPAIGTGAGTHLFYGRFFRRPQIQADPEHAHSDYLEMLAEYGLIGLAGIVVFVFVHLHSASAATHRIARTADGYRFHLFRNDELALQIGATAAIAAFAAHSVTDFNLHIPGNALLFAFIFGMVANPGGTTASAPIAPTPPVRAFQLLLPALGVWLLVAGVLIFPGEYWSERSRIAMHYRDFVRAAEFARKGLQFQSRNPSIYFQLAGGDAGMALTEKNPNTRRELLVEAVNACQHALRIYPSDRPTWVRLARVLDDLRRFREARQAYEAAVSLDPKLGALRAFYARHLAIVGRLDEAAEQIRKSRELGSLRDPGEIIRGTPLDTSGE